MRRATSSLSSRPQLSSPARRCYRSLHPSPAPDSAPSSHVSRPALPLLPLPPRSSPISPRAISWTTADRRSPAGAPRHRSTQPLLQRSRDKRIALPVRVVRPPPSSLSHSPTSSALPRYRPDPRLHRAGAQGLLRQRAHLPLVAQLYVRRPSSSSSSTLEPSPDALLPLFPPRHLHRSSNPHRPRLNSTRPAPPGSVVLGGLAVGLLNFGDRVGKISAGMFTFVGASLSPRCVARVCSFWDGALTLLLLALDVQR